MQVVINWGDKIASIVSALVGLVALSLRLYSSRKNAGKQSPGNPHPPVHQDTPGSPEQAGTSSRPDFPAVTRERALALLGAVWLLATVLIISASFSDSSGAYYLGLGLIGVVFIVILIIAAVSGYTYLMDTRPLSSPQSRRHLSAGCLTVLPLVLAGYVFAVVARNNLGMPVIWIAPVFGAAFYAVSAIRGLAYTGRAQLTRTMNLSLVAITTGVIIGVVTFAAEIGPRELIDVRERSWLVHSGVKGAQAEVKIRQTTGDKIRLSGTLEDNSPNYTGAELNIDVRDASGLLRRESTFNRLGAGKVVLINNKQDGYEFPASTQRITVTACLAGRQPERDCGQPVEVWRR